MKTNDTLEKLKIKSKWENVYWFSRMLISNDKYGSIGKDNSLLAVIASTLRIIESENKSSSSNDIIALQKMALKNLLLNRFKKAKSRLDRIQRLIRDLESELITPDDINTFILTCESIMIPINQAIENIPSNDKDFTLSIATSYLDIQGENGLATVINIWDDLGVKGCLTVERNEIIRAFSALRLLLTSDYKIEDFDKDVILTSFVQEFERRAAQKRKSRAGSSLEDVTTFILDYFKIKSAKAPAHFQADIEIDNWVKSKDGWLIGISCKRTLRERWKQVSSAESGILSKFKIKNVYHILTFDEDLSDDKITLLGNHRHIFYLPDNSRILNHAVNHIGLKEYVRPMSLFIEDLRKETN